MISDTGVELLRVTDDVEDLEDRGTPLLIHELGL